MSQKLHSFWDKLGIVLMVNIVYNIIMKYIYDNTIDEKTLWNWCVLNNRTEILDQITPKEKCGEIAKNTTFGSNKVIKFTCEYGHVYEKSVKTRRGTISLCPVCAKGKNTSFPEQTILFYVKKVFPNAESRVKVFDEEIDIYIPEVKIGIEYNGYRWHREIKNTNEKEIEKQRKLSDNGISLLLVNEIAGKENYVDCKNNCLSFVYNRKEIYKAGLELLVNSVFDWISEIINVDFHKPKISMRRDIQKIFSSYNTFCGKDKSVAYSKEKKVKEKLMFWDYDKNKITPEMVSKFSSIHVWWKCEVCGKSFVKSVQHVIGGDLKHVCCEKCGKKLWSGKTRKIINLTTEKIYDSIAEAAKDCDDDGNNIQYACSHRVPRLRCLWMYYSEYEKLDVTEKKRIIKKAKMVENFTKHRVRVKDLETGIIYESIAEAARKSGNSIGAIQNSIRKKKPNLSGKQWVLV